MPRTPFVENIQTKKAERPAIIVQEELRRIYVSLKKNNRILNSIGTRIFLIIQIFYKNFFLDLDEPLAFKERSL